MSWRSRATQRHIVQPRTKPWRRTGIVLLMGIALTIAACGASTGGGAPQPTPTPKLSPTASPAPCASWRIIPSPNATKYQANGLFAVTALSPTLAWAVGANYAPDSTFGPVASLVEQWDGTAWRLIVNPGLGFLDSVAALSATDVWAVGSQTVTLQPLAPTALILHWNGTRWSVIPSALPTSTRNELHSVVAVATNDVWAVGEYYNASNAQLPLIEHWDGTAWHVATTPALPGVTRSTLSTAARIPGAPQLWAVGSTQKSVSSPEQMLIERWDGVAWQIVAGPTLPDGATSGSLSGVVALSATDAWAVGEYSGSDGTPRALIAHWNGATWQRVTSPTTYASLRSVAAASATDVRAIGWFETTYGGNMDPLMLQWNGSAWRQVTSPTGNLNSINTDGASNYWIVGFSRDATGNSHTLTLHCPEARSSGCSVLRACQ